MRLKRFFMVAALVPTAAVQAQLISLDLLNQPQAQPGAYLDAGINAGDAATASPTPSIVAASPPPTCSTMPAGVVAWWRAESNTVDSIGINDCLSQDGPVPGPSYMAGKVGVAFRFPSSPLPPRSGSYLLVPFTPELDVGAGEGLTVEGWLRPDSVSGSQPVIEWGDSRGIIGAGLALSGSAIQMILTDTNSRSIRPVVIRSPAGTVAAAVWQHVALTFNKADGLARVYLNGIPVVQTNVGVLVPQTQAPIYWVSGSGELFAAAQYSGGIDEMTIYNRALSVLEIQSIVAAAETGKCLPAPAPCVPPPADFVGWWRGESNAFDSVDANHGVIVNSVTYGSGVVSNGFQFINGYLRVPASSSLDVGLGPGLTIETWVAPEYSINLFGAPLSREFVGWHVGLVPQGVSLSIISISQPPPYPPFPFLSPYSTIWQASLVDTLGRSHVIQSPAGLATLGAWQHVALTYDKAAGTAALYFNGNPVAQTNLGTFTPRTTGDLLLGYQASSLPIPPWPDAW
jgi:hypothetical protein